jgi:uncharacterized protein YwqG
MQLSESAASRLPSLARQYLGQAADTLLSAVSPSIRLHRTQACDPASPASRLGGTALLVRGQPWPVTDDGTPLSFIGQISTRDISAPAGCPPLPADSLLAFFYDAERQEAWGDRPDDRPYWRVIATPRGAAVPVDPPGGAPLFAAHQVVPENVITLPHEVEEINDQIHDAAGDALERLYQELGSGLPGKCHRMFGWPDLLQRPMQLECQLAFNGVRLAGPADRDPRVPELRSGAADWLLLLQVDTDDDVGWMWGDSGIIYYWIRRQDLHAARFDRVWMILQCG